MRQGRLILGVFVVVAAVLSAYLGVTAQEKRAPWPPAPVMPPPQPTEVLPGAKPPTPTKKSKTPAKNHAGQGFVIIDTHAGREEKYLPAPARLHDNSTVEPPLADHPPTATKSMTVPLPKSAAEIETSLVKEPVPGVSAEPTAIPLPVPKTQKKAEAVTSPALQPGALAIPGVPKTQELIPLPAGPKTQGTQMEVPLPTAGNKEPAGKSFTIKDQSIAEPPKEAVGKPAVPLPLTVPVPSVDPMSPPGPLQGPVTPPMAPPAGALLDSDPVTKPVPKTPAKPPAFRLVNPIRKVEMNPDGSAAPAPAQAWQSGPAAQTPLLTLEKRGPVTLKSGTAFPYEIVVRNIGRTAAHNVRIEDELPVGARLVSGDPQPVLQGERLTWALDSIEAGGERRLKVELMPTLAGEGRAQASLTVTISSGLATKVAQGQIGLRVQGPASVAMGQPVVFEVQVSNPGAVALNKLVLFARLPAGLGHPMGSEIEADVGDLQPGESKTVRMPTTAVKNGRHVVEVRIGGQNGQEANTRALVQVVDGGLVVSQSPALQLVLARESELMVEVANHTPEGLRNVAIVDTLPEGLDFVGASERGLYREPTRSIHWLIDYLPAGQTKTLSVRVVPKEAGTFANQVEARVDQGPESRSTARVQVEGVSDLEIKVVDRDDPLEVGKDTIYEVRLLNHGSAPATGLKVQVSVPEGMKPGQAQGPAAYRIEGQQVLFAPVAQLPAKGQIVFHVSVRALAAGEHRLRAQVTSDQVRLPVFREERTLVYRDK